MVDILKNSDYKTQATQKLNENEQDKRDTNNNEPAEAQAIVNKKEDIAKRTQELIDSKEFNIHIKEKSYHSFTTIKPKKTLKVKTVLQKKTQKPKVPKKVKALQVGFIGMLWVGVFVAIDTNLIDIGWKPPFSLFNRATKGGQVTGTVEVGGGR
jgi:hypothetical protein